MHLHGKSIVGDRLSDGSGLTFHATSPLNAAPLEPAFYAAGEQDVEAAMAIAEAAFATYRETTGGQRAVFL